MSDLAEIFKAYDIRGKVGTQLNPQFAYNVGRAFADWLPAKGTVVVGHDMRPDSEALATALMDGIRAQGRDTWDIGLVTSDVVYFAPGKFDLAGGVMITASHNPGEYNGIKFCREKALPVGIETGLAEIRDAVLSEVFKPAAAQPGNTEKKDLLGAWVEHLLGFVKPGALRPLRIGIDAGNGMGGHVWPKLAEHLPIETVPLYFELDGTFPNHEANPMKVETLNDLSALVREQKLDFGVAFDGDGDRMALMDEHGTPLTGSMTAALLSEYVLQQYPGATIVHDLRLSRSALDLIHTLGGKTVPSRVGNTFIKALMRDQDAAFGAEITGHLMFKDNYFVDSGCLAALIAIQVLSDADFTLSEFVARTDTYQHTPEVNLHVEDKQAALDKIARAFPDGEADHFDGLTISYPDKWFNIRPSNTEPVLRLNAEAANQKDLDELVERVTNLVEGESS
jgi:phosphomannomutase